MDSVVRQNGTLKIAVLHQTGLPLVQSHLTSIPLAIAQVSILSCRTLVLT